MEGKSGKNSSMYSIISRIGTVMNSGTTSKLIKKSNVILMNSSMQCLESRTCQCVPPMKRSVT